MKIELIESKQESDKIKYPILMKDTKSDMVVLFVSANEGTIINGINRAGCSIGKYDDDWISAENKNEWKPFKGKIVLSNE